MVMVMVMVEDDSDLHGKHEGGKPVVASDVETCGRVGEQQLHHFHLIMTTLMLMLQLTLMLLMMMLLMIHLPTASSIHQRNATKTVSVIQIIVFEKKSVFIQMCFHSTRRRYWTNLELMSTPSSSKDRTTSISPLTIDNTDQNGDYVLEIYCKDNLSQAPQRPLMMFCSSFFLPPPSLLVGLLCSPITVAPPSSLFVLLLTSSLLLPLTTQPSSPSSAASSLSIPLPISWERWGEGWLWSTCIDPQYVKRTTFYKHIVLS